MLVSRLRISDKSYGAKLSKIPKSNWTQFFFLVLFFRGIQWTPLFFKSLKQVWSDSTISRTQYYSVGWPASRHFCIPHSHQKIFAKRRRWQKPPHCKSALLFLHAGECWQRSRAAGWLLRPTSVCSRWVWAAHVGEKLHLSLWFWYWRSPALWEELVEDWKLMSCG